MAPTFSRNVTQLQTVRVEKRDAVPPAQIQVRGHRRHRRHVDVFGLRKQREAHRAVLGVVAGDQFLFGLRKIKRGAVRFGDTGDDVDDEPERLQEHASEG